MYFKRLCIVSTFIFLIFSFHSFGQEDVLQLIPYDGDTTSYVNWQIIADTIATNGLLPNRVYELERDGIYLHNRIFTVPNGATLRMRAAEGAGEKPIIYLWESGTGQQPTRPPGNFAVLNGGNIDLKNICIAGFYEPEPDRVDGVQGGLINTTASGSTIILDGVIMSNIAGQHVRTGSNTVKIQVTNSIFANMGALTTSNLGAGKGFDLRAAECDSFIVLNNTFVNYQDRPIRHYNFGNPDPDTGGTEPINYGRIEHNSFINGMGYHGLLSLGNVGPNIIIKNNLFVDGFALGEDSTDATRAAEWANTGEFYANGNNRITWIFTAQNNVTQWNVRNNYYTISSEGQGWLDDNHFGHGPFGPGSPLTWHINSRLGADSVDAFTEEAGLTLNNIPALMTNMMTWYEDPNGGNREKNTPSAAFDRTLHDFDRRVIQYYRDTLDASYSTSAAAYTGSDLGFPVGDLNWFPDKKAEWEVYEPLDITIDGDKDEFYNSLTGPDDGYLQVRSFAFNDNGAPDDDADLSAKIWTAWDNEWFFLYQEVMDNVLLGNAANVYENDCIELKFDAEPTDSVTNSIWDTRLTIDAADVVTGDSLNNVSDANKMWARKTIEGGYALELAIKWSAIGHNNPETNESIIPAVGTVFGLGIANHDNDAGSRESSIQWAAIMLDAIWNTPKYLGTVEFLADNKLQFIPTNNMTGVTNPLPYDGTSVDVDQTSSLIPKEFGLSQNYPNPFNPSTTIEFALPKQAAVELAVYNLLGERVAVLINQELSPGYHEIAFNADLLPSGIYFYRIQAGSFVQTKKLMLLK